MVVFHHGDAAEDKGEEVHWMMALEAEAITIAKL